MRLLKLLTDSFIKASVNFVALYFSLAKASASYSYLRENILEMIPVINETGENKKAKASKPMWKDGTLAPKAYDNSGLESAYQSSATSMAV